MPEMQGENLIPGADLTERVLRELRDERLPTGDEVEIPVEEQSRPQPTSWQPKRGKNVLQRSRDVVRKEQPHQRGGQSNQSSHTRGGGERDLLRPGHEDPPTPLW